MSNARDKANIPALNFSSTGIDDNATSTAITIDSNERVGIGTTSVSTNLQVTKASSGASGVLSATTVSLFENSGNTDIVIGAGNTSKSRIGFGDNGDAFNGRIDYDHSDRSMRFGTGGQAERMRIDSSGRVGIGTSSPSKILQVSSNDPVIRLTDTDTGATHSLSGSSSVRNFDLVVDDGGSSGSPRFSVQIQNSGKFYILNSGNVGIGTATPTQKLDVSGTVKATAFQGDGSALTGVGGGGKVLQVVSTTKTDTFSAGNVSTYADITGLSASITPSATSSKILCIVNINSSSDQNTNANFFRLVRGSTAISVGGSAGSRILASAHVISRDTQRQNLSSFNFLDSPSTTSATTYKIQYQNGGAGGGNCRINRGYGDSDNNDNARTASTITLMEIGA